MPRLRIRAWNVGEAIMDSAGNSTNGTDIPDLEQKVINICKGGAIGYTSKELVKNLIIDATPNLLL